jgi:hypothetical protein
MIFSARNATLMSRTIQHRPMARAMPLGPGIDRVDYWRARGHFGASRQHPARAPDRVIRCRRFYFVGVSSDGTKWHSVALNSKTPRLAPLAFLTHRQSGRRARDGQRKETRLPPSPTPTRRVSAGHPRMPATICCRCAVRVGRGSPTPALGVNGGLGFFIPLERPQKMIVNDSQ